MSGEALEPEGLARLAREMERFGNDRDAPARSVMGMLGDRWTTLILLVLREGEYRHAELRRVLCQLSAEQAISQRVLTMKLRALERDGFVLRDVSDDVPPKVNYRLGEAGMALADRARDMIDWINTDAARIHAARERFDAAED